MKEQISKKLGIVETRFPGNRKEYLHAYYTFQDYGQIWGMTIFVLLAASLLPLVIMTIIHYQLIERSIDTESLLRTERLASNARRAVTFFLEERLDALTFTANEMSYRQLSDLTSLSTVLKNLKLGFGGLTDLSLIDDTGNQVAYAGPFSLEGKDYSSQPWFIECQKNNACVSEIFLGYRDVPHIVVAVKSQRPDGRFYVLRATLATERLIQTLSSFRTGEHADIFLVNREGLLQTPSQHYRDGSQHVTIPVPEYSDRTKSFMTVDNQGHPIAVGYAYITTNIVPTTFVLMVVKRKESMMKVWLDLRAQINWVFGVSSVIIAIVIFLTSSFMVNKIYQADREKAKTMALAEQNFQLASIGQLAAGVAHEINNPLALINETAGYVRDLFMIKQQYKDDQELIEHIDAIIDAVERCGTITRQLLGFARRFDIQTQAIRLQDMVDDVLNFHKKEAQYRNISLRVNIPADIPDIKTDRGKLQQIVLNLVNNAFQAIDDDCFLEISAAMEDPEHVELVIRDNGSGIPEEHLSKIFEPFFTTKKEGQGTGLGLSITYGLVQELHGTIRVDSNVGEGTAFFITLPIEVDKEMQS